MADMHAITEAAIEATRAVVKAVTKVIDPAEVSPLRPSN